MKDELRRKKWIEGALGALLLFSSFCLLPSAFPRPFFIPWKNASGGAGFISAVNNKASTPSSTDATAYTTSAFTPTANALLVATFTATRGSSTDPGVVTVTDSASLTWTQVRDFAYITSGSTRGRVAVYAAQAPSSPASMTVTGTYGGTCTGSTIHVFEVLGSDVANGVGQSFVQSVPTTANASGTSAAVTLAAAGNSRNRAFMVSVHLQANEDTVPAASWTEIGDTAHATPGESSATEWRSDVFDTAPSANWTTSSTYGAIGFEVKAQ